MHVESTDAPFAASLFWQRDQLKNTAKKGMEMHCSVISL